MKANADFFNRAMLMAIAFLFSGVAVPTAATGQADRPGDGGETTEVPPYISERTDYAWPISSGTYLSSSFGETRSRHFHSALDIKTWGRRGYEVYATRDGLLHRVGVSPKGYGKVVYLKHEDGSYSVYAHLMEFARPIKNLVDSLRLAEYTFTLDRYLESHDIHFEKGDLIAYSGASGVGPPHLHFELRTPSQKPFNPLLTGMRHRIKDTRPPQFSRLAVEPLSPDSYVDGQIETQTYRARRNTEGDTDYRFGPVKVSGKTGLGVDVFDLANEVNNAYAVYDLKLMKEDEVLFHSRVDSFSYKETGQMVLDRVYPLLRTTGDGFQRLHLVDGNSLPFYKHKRGKGVLNLPEGRHELRIVASDYFGNQSSATVVLEAVNTSNPRTRNPEKQDSFYQFSDRQANSSTAPTMGIEELDSWTWHNDWIVRPVDRDKPVRYAAVSMERPSYFWHTYRRTQSSGIHYTTNRVVVDLRGEASTVLRKKKGSAGAGQTGGTDTQSKITLHRIPSGQSAEVVSADQKTRLKFTPSTFYDTLSVAFLHSNTADSTVFHVMPRHVPLKGRYTLSHVVSSGLQNQDGLGFYEVDPEDGKLSYLGTSREGPRLKARPENFGTFTIRADSLAPRIHNPRLVHRRDGTWLARVDVKDPRSGIDYETAKIWCNGQRGIPEYDPEEETVSYYHPDFTPGSRNNLRVYLSDRAGNQVDTTFTLNR